MDLVGAEKEGEGSLILRSGDLADCPSRIDSFQSRHIRPSTPFQHPPHPPDGPPQSPYLPFFPLSPPPLSRAPFSALSLSFCLSFSLSNHQNNSYASLLTPLPCTVLFLNTPRSISQKPFTLGFSAIFSIISFAL